MSWRRAADVGEGFLALGGIGVIAVHYSPWLWLDVVGWALFGIALIAAGVFAAGFLMWKLFAWVADDGRP